MMVYFDFNWGCFFIFSFSVDREVKSTFVPEIYLLYMFGWFGFFFFPSNQREKEYMLQLVLKY